MYEFGLGKLIALPVVDSGVVSAPVEFGTLQDVTTGFSFDKKELYGQKSFPVKVARGKGKIDCKASFAKINALSFNQILGGTVATGTSRVITSAVTVPASSTYTITVAPTTGTFATDLGVMDVSSSLVAIPMTAAATAVAGSYSVTSSGVYSFAAGDAAKAVLITYKTTNTTGNTITITNNLMGTAPVFRVVLFNALDGIQMVLQLNAATTTKFDMAWKMEDFMIPAFDFSCFADASDIIGYCYFEQTG